MAPPLKPSSDLCGRMSATALWLAGPRQDARVSSPRLAITRLVLTDTPDPELEPSEADACRVVGVGGIAAPGAALVAQHRRQHLVGPVAAARIARPPVVFRVDGLGEDDRALVAELLDQHVIARREVDVVARVTAGGGAHVLRVERILEREDDAIHRHLLEIGIASIRGVELGRALEGVREAGGTSRTRGVRREEAAPRTDAGRSRPGR